MSQARTFAVPADIPKERQLPGSTIWSANGRNEGAKLTLCNGVADKFGPIDTQEGTQKPEQCVGRNVEANFSTAPKSAESERFRLDDGDPYRDRTRRCQRLSSRLVLSLKDLDPACLPLRGSVRALL